MMFCGLGASSPSACGLPALVARFSGVASLTVLLACSPSQPRDDTTVDVPPLPSASETPISSQTPDLSGTWSSATCGKRAYERIIIVTSDGKFTADDRVSPCPPDKQCVWSGIVHRTGTWKRVALTLALFPDEVAGKQAGEPFPSTLAPAGSGIEDDFGCAYVKRS
jgi:hypothetical protein